MEYGRRLYPAAITTTTIIMTIKVHPRTARLCTGNILRLDRANRFVVLAKNAELVININAIVNYYAGRCNKFSEFNF
jgi:hypothetical protein